MLRKVKVKIKKAELGASIDRAPNGFNSKELPTNTDIDRYSQKNISVGKTLTAVPREEANLEAEGGETAVTNLNKDGIPEQYNIKGARHSNGGVPLNLPEESFIFSDTAEMKIKDPDLLKFFNMPPKKGGYTPAEIAKKYDLNKYKKILLDEDSDKLQRETAEMMIANYNGKLAQLALIQESMKGFPQGIPKIAFPYLEKMGIDPNQLMGTQGEQEQPDEQQVSKYGSEIKNGLRKVRLRKAQGGEEVNNHGAVGSLERYDWDGSWPKGQSLPINPSKHESGYPAPYGNPYYGMPQDPNMTVTFPTISTKTTKVQNVPTNATRHDESNKNYDPSKVKAGDYVKGADGKWRKATGLTGGGVRGGSFSGPDNYKQFYGTDIKEDVAAAKQILEEKAKQKGSGITKVGNKFNFAKGAEDVLTLEEKALVTKLAGYQGEKGYGAKEHGLELGSQNFNKYGFVGFVDPELLEYQNWKSKKENWNKKESDFKQLSAEDKKTNRVAYLKKLNYTDEEINNLGDKLEDPSKLYTPEFVGKPTYKDGQFSGDPNSLVARTQKSFGKEQFRPYKADDYLFGWEHADFYQEDKPQMSYENVAEEDAAAIAGDPLKAQRYTGDEVAPWFLQDVVNTWGSAADLARRKKYMPWQASPELYLPEPTYYDPTRQLAANAEQANIQTQGAASFAGPQAFSARSARIQGQAARQAADILGQYDTMNVGVANQFEQQRAQLKNQDAIRRGLDATQLYDKTTIANQMYDAERDAARQALRTSYRDAISNRANAQVMNSLYPQYHIDPSTGGMMTWMGGRDIHPSQDNQGDLLGEMANLRSTYPGWTERAYQDAAKQKLGMVQENNPYDMAEYQAQQAAMMQEVNPYQT